MIHSKCCLEQRIVSERPLPAAELAGVLFTFVFLTAIQGLCFYILCLFINLCAHASFSFAWTWYLRISRRDRLLFVLKVKMSIWFSDTRFHRYSWIPMLIMIFRQMSHRMRIAMALIVSDWLVLMESISLRWEVEDVWEASTFVSMKLSLQVTVNAPWAEALNRLGVKTAMRWVTGISHVNTVITSILGKKKTEHLLLNSYKLDRHRCKINLTGWRRHRYARL